MVKVMPKRGIELRRF